MEDIEYQLEPVSATKVASEDIDRTFRSSCIGKPITKIRDTERIRWIEELIQDSCTFSKAASG